MSSPPPPPPDGRASTTPQEVGERRASRDVRFVPILRGRQGRDYIRRALSVVALLGIDVSSAFLGLYAVLAFKLFLQGQPIDSGAIWSVEQKALHGRTRSEVFTALVGASTAGLWAGVAVEQDVSGRKLTPPAVWSRMSLDPYASWPLGRTSAQVRPTAAQPAPNRRPTDAQPALN